MKVSIVFIKGIPTYFLGCYSLFFMENHWVIHITSVHALALTSNWICVDPAYISSQAAGCAQSQAGTMVYTSSTMPRAPGPYLTHQQLRAIILGPDRAAEGKNIRKTTSNKQSFCKICGS